MTDIITSKCINCSGKFTDEGIFLTDESKPLCNSCKTFLKEPILKVLKVLTLDDWEDLSSGHDIYKKEFYTKMGFSEDFVIWFVRTHKSDGTWKGSITTTEGKMLSTVFGVYNLEFLTGLRDIFDLKSEFFFGRGSYARAIINDLKEVARK